jgi:hypothetical protein
MKLIKKTEFISLLNLGTYKYFKKSYLKPIYNNFYSLEIFALIDFILEHFKFKLHNFLNLQFKISEDLNGIN